MDPRTDRLIAEIPMLDPLYCGERNAEFDHDRWYQEFRSLLGGLSDPQTLARFMQAVTNERIAANVGWALVEADSVPAEFLGAWLRKALCFDDRSLWMSSIKEVFLRRQQLAEFLALLLSVIKEPEHRSSALQLYELFRNYFRIPTLHAIHEAKADPEGFVARRTKVPELLSRDLAARKGIQNHMKRQATEDRDFLLATDAESLVAAWSLLVQIEAEIGPRPSYT